MPPDIVNSGDRSSTSCAGGHETEVMSFYLESALLVRHLDQEIGHSRTYYDTECCQQSANIDKEGCHMWLTQFSADMKERGRQTSKIKRQQFLLS